MRPLRSLRRHGLAVATLLLAGCVTQVPQNQSQLQAIFQTDKTLCGLAIGSVAPEWREPGSFYAVGAQRRGLSEIACARLTGRFTKAQIAAFHSAPKGGRGVAIMRAQPQIPKPSRTAGPAPELRPPLEERAGVPPIVSGQSRAPPAQKRSHGSAGSGSGFFVSGLGHVITNAHILDKCRRITVGDNGDNQTPAALINSDRRSDLALLKLGSLETASVGAKSLIRKLGLKIVPLAAHGLLRAKDVELGEDVLVGGFPFGDYFSSSVKVTKGIVSSVRGIGDDAGQFQMDAAVQAGNSGGPIYDENGNIVGVVIAQLNKLRVAKAIGSLPENVNFGIKASTVRQFLTASGLPSKWASRDKRISTKALAAIAQKQTLMVQCHQ
ncbi:MAG: trypsin-like peptidase domain-containing protein [Rhodospirillaceae bacterium]|jgi:S1-C subfamily serine protease|nr:trypsin-like peptidase domain-containing protein [Rhodospirillaceae bacterium]MBT4117182.1 trypsin-like peptidase domain-containing protein [Rhodospirillaceae bacterium]MBT4748923.1 trypsin-like peptidase domain-containing protein [Rhodospirillaceae bacterium]MBT5841589.1 trypsin-like peptidase domain-containing protein [Rhodospirillaceae bacterium]MBT6857731.1 trypsin-like peptidase domain-containing protein [Rhodospirillaceae bacterium]